MLPSANFTAYRPARSGRAATESIIVSFAQMFLPISVATKGVLWVVFFGLAKTFQYSALVVLGAEGLKRVKNWWKNREH